MNPQRSKDPLIREPGSVTILGPLIEVCLRFAGIQPNREQLLDRFMSGQPRVAIVHGSEDHPCNLGRGCRNFIRRLIRQVWTEGALPIQVSLAVPCQELAETLPEAPSAFLGRNICAANFSILVESHGYDAALVVAICDTMSVGVMRALVEADLGRQHRGAHPVYALFIPPSIGREVRLSKEEIREFELLRKKLPESECEAMFGLLELPVNAERYRKIQTCLDRAQRKRAIVGSERIKLERVVAARVLASPPMGASSETSIVNRLMIAAFGVVPRRLDITVDAPTDRQLSDALGRMFQCIRKRERRSSVASLVKSNLQNSLAVWTATGAHPSWLIHLNYLAQALGVAISPALLKRKMLKVPRLLSLCESDGLSAHGLAEETEAGGNSGIDTLMRTLSEKRLIDDRAKTLDGSWTPRIMGARSANGRYFHSTITPHAPTSGVFPVHGNFSTEALFRCSDESALAAFDKKLYFADFYLGRGEFAEALGAGRDFLDPVRRKVTREDLYRMWSINQKGDSSPQDGQVLGWSKQRLWDHLIENDLLRCVLVVAGEGPRASGMPEIRIAESIHSAVIRKTCVLATDGRAALARDMMCIVHIVPEAIEGGGLAAVRTGDWIYLNLRKGELQVVKANPSGNGFRALSERELNRRNELARRVHELERRRESVLPSLLSVLEHVSSAAQGVSPLTH